MAKENWFQTGNAGWKNSKKERDEAKARKAARDNSMMRFYLQPDSSAKFTFLANPDFFIYEHNLHLDGKWFNFFTCLGHTGNCPVCDSGDKPSYVLIGEGICHKKWTDKDGNERKNQRMLIVLKGKALEVFQRRMEKLKGNVKFCCFEFTRGTGSTECSTGEDIEFIKRLDAATIKKLCPADKKPKEYFKLTDLPKMFKPKDAKALRAVVGADDPFGGDDDASDDDDIFGDDDPGGGDDLGLDDADDLGLDDDDDPGLEDPEDPEDPEADPDDDDDDIFGGDEDPEDPEPEEDPVEDDPVDDSDDDDGVSIDDLI